MPWPMDLTQESGLQGYYNKSYCLSIRTSHYQGGSKLQDRARVLKDRHLEESKRDSSYPKPREGREN